MISVSRFGGVVLSNNIKYYVYFSHTIFVDFHVLNRLENFADIAAELFEA